MYKRQFKYIMILTGLVLLLIAPENLSTAMLLFGVVFMMMFIGRVAAKKLLLLAGGLVLIVALGVGTVVAIPAKTPVSYTHLAVNKKAEEGKRKKRTSLKSILGGDILATDFFRRQTKLLVLIMVFVIFYIHNRYASQQQQIEIDRLKKELIDIKYDALTRSSELMEKSRQSRIEEYISNKESDLQLSLIHI